MTDRVKFSSRRQPAKAEESEQAIPSLPRKRGRLLFSVAAGGSAVSGRARFSSLGRRGPARRARGGARLGAGLVRHRAGAGIDLPLMGARVGLGAREGALVHRLRARLAVGAVGIDVGAGLGPAVDRRGAAAGGDSRGIAAGGADSDGGGRGATGAGGAGAAAGG